MNLNTLAPRKVSAVAKGGQSLVIIGQERVTVAALKGEMLAALGNDWKALASGLVRSFGAGPTVEQPHFAIRARGRQQLTVRGEGQGVHRLAQVRTHFRLPG